MICVAYLIANYLFLRNANSLGPANDIFMFPTATMIIAVPLFAIPCMGWRWGDSDEHFIGAIITLVICGSVCVFLKLFLYPMAILPILGSSFLATLVGIVLLFGAFWYDGGRKVCIDGGGFFTGEWILLNLDTMESHIIKLDKENVE
jgi:hypothetical protein